MSKATKLTLWILQLVTVAILAPEAWGKLSSSPDAIFVFSELGMEPTGRYLVGAVEMLASILLLSPRLSATGALLAVGTMLGAIIAHVSSLGIDMLGDGGRHVMQLSSVLLCSGVVAVVRRHQLPLIGNSFEE